MKKGLPIRPPFPPMEARSAEELPTGAGWLYEPKWDGFRCLAFRNATDVELQSKSGQPLARYFPELVGAIEAIEAKRFVLDAEIAILLGRTLSFDDLLQRLHPAASRVEKLSRETPAVLIVFDLLVDEKGSLLTSLPLAQRRERLERFAERYLAGRPAFRLSPATTDVARARRWLQGGAGSRDGIIAKKLAEPYQSGNRTGMQKIKRMRTADCVVGGFRYASGKKVVGSLLLGLYDDDGALHHVGFTSSIPRGEAEALTAKLEKRIEPPGFTGRAPGGPSRWSGREEPWHPLAPVFVVEVRYDHVTGHRFRHGTRLLRWRPDKAPRQCTLEQIG